jgi:hypothetical protein
MSNLIIPAHMKTARQHIRIVFYRYPKLNNRLTVGFPDNFPAPPGAEKIVCTTAREVEKYSQMIRDQEKIEQEMSEYERELIEGPMRAYVRAELRHRMENSDNQINRDFCAYALKQLDEKEEKGRTIRESHMHIEAHEQGK